MVRPPEAPRRSTEGNRLPFGPYDPRAGAAIHPRQRNRLRSQQVVPRRDDAPIYEIIHNNVVTRQMFQNLLNRYRPNNTEHNSMIIRAHMEQPMNPNVRETRNKPRNARITDAEHQRNRPGAIESFIRERTEIKRLLESYMADEPQPGTSGASGSGGSEGNADMRPAGGYWRPDLNASTSSSDEELPGNGGSTKAFMSPSKRIQTSDLLQKALASTNSSSTSSSEEWLPEKEARTNASRNPRKRQKTRDILQEVKEDLRALAEKRRKDARMTGNRNLSESSDSSDESDTGPWSSASESSEETGTSSPDSSESAETIRQVTSSSTPSWILTDHSSYATVGVSVQNSSSVSCVGSESSPTSSRSASSSRASSPFHVPIARNSASKRRREHSSIRICNEYDCHTSDESETEAETGADQERSTTGTAVRPYVLPTGNGPTECNGGMQLRPRVSRVGSTFGEVRKPKIIEVKWKRPPPHQQAQAAQRADMQRILSQDVPSTSQAPNHVQAKAAQDGTTGQNGCDAVAYNTRRAVKRRLERENGSRQNNEAGGEDEGGGGKRRRF